MPPLPPPPKCSSVCYMYVYIPVVSQRTLSDQSKEEYREAAHRLYMEERQRAKSMGQRSSSPQPSSSTSTEFSGDR